MVIAASIAVVIGNILLFYLILSHALCRYNILILVYIPFTIECAAVFALMKYFGLYLFMLPASYLFIILSMLFAEATGRVRSRGNWISLGKYFGTLMITMFAGPYVLISFLLAVFLN